MAVERDEVAVERERFDLQKQKTDYLLELVDKIGDAKAKEIVLKRLKTAIYDLATGDADEVEIRRSARAMLPPPKRRRKRQRS